MNGHMNLGGSPYADLLLQGFFSSVWPQLDGSVLAGIEQLTRIDSTFLWKVIFLFASTVTPGKVGIYLTGAGTR